MTTFIKNKNSFKSASDRTQLDLHANCDLEIPKDTKHPFQEKRSLLIQVENLIKSFETNDFGIRFIVMKAAK